MNKPMFGSTGGQHPLARWVDHNETYGPHLVSRMVNGIDSIDRVVDIGAGSGRDLALVKRHHPDAKTIAIEASKTFAEGLRGKADEIHVLDIERSEFPFQPDSIDLFIANQILEHTKEVFWIFDQVTRALKVGGHFLFAVPNVASFHNRLLLMAGVHPTQYKMCSPHVRTFSKADTVKFLNACFPDGYELVDFGGSQFFPLPKPLARVASSVFPTMAVSIFFLIRKKRAYTSEFASYPSLAQFETNFWAGPYAAEGGKRY